MDGLQGIFTPSRSLEGEGILDFPYELDYCNMQGHDLEHSSEAWAATKAVLKTKISPLSKDCGDHKNWGCPADLLTNQTV